jgi:hypothetical protein
MAAAEHAVAVVYDSVNDSVVAGGSAGTIVTVP